MTKSEAFKTFNDSYGKLSDSDREAFSRISLKLLDETFLVKGRDEGPKALQGLSSSIRWAVDYRQSGRMAAFGDRWDAPDAPMCPEILPSFYVGSVWGRMRGKKRRHASPNATNAIAQRHPTYRHTNSSTAS